MEEPLSSRRSGIRKGLFLMAVLIGAVAIYASKVVLANVWVAFGFGSDGMRGEAEIAGEGWLLAGAVGVWVGAWLAARLYGSGKISYGIVPGICAWALAAVLSLALVRAGHQEFAGATETLLNGSAGSDTAMGGTGEDDQTPGPGRAWISSTGVRWGFLLLGIEIVAAAWGGWVGTAALRRGGAG